MQKCTAHGLEAQIKSLKEEISLLQEQHERNALLDVKCRMKGAQGTGVKHTAASLKSEIKEMEDDLVSQTKMNGISLTGCCVKTMEQSDTKIVQQHRITGHCSTLTFQIEFELTDVKEEETFVRSITDLSIEMDGSEFKDLSTFVSRAQDKKNLLLFFRTLRTFSERLEDKHRTFQHFQEKYPNVVSLPGGCRSKLMLIRNPQLPGCALMLHWNIEVTQEGEITPKIELLAKMPETALQMDSSNVIKNSPMMFQSLLRVAGVEASIESIIKTWCTAR